MVPTVMLLAKTTCRCALHSTMHSTMLECYTPYYTSPAPAAPARPLGEGGVPAPAKGPHTAPGPATPTLTPPHTPTLFPSLR